MANDPAGFAPDPLTLLPGRAAFHARLAAELETSGACVGVLLVDLDGLRGLNHALGLRGRATGFSSA